MPALPDLGDHAVLDRQPVASLAAWQDAGGGSGLTAARRLGPIGIVEEVAASGLRGRGGAGFPTGTKWRAVLEHASAEVPTTVVVNGAEGEPGSFKDRALMRRNPFRVLEGALIAATAVGAARVVIAVKASFEREAAALEAAAAEMHAAGWTEGVAVEVLGGPSEYLYGEETALLEVMEGRHPFPRLAPPFRRGADEVGSDSAEAAGTDMAGPGSVAPPALVNNVETVANLPGILQKGADWFRALGTEACPGTIVCTVTGRVRHPAVGEVPFGTPLADVLAGVGGGPLPGRQLVAVLPGVSGPVLSGPLLATPATHEDLQAAGSSLGAATFIVLDDATDPVAVAASASRFLAVESCGQCAPCKGDGVVIAEILDRLRRSESSELDLLALDDRLRLVTNGARCSLALQHQAVVGSLSADFADRFRAHALGDEPAADVDPVVPLVDVDDGRATLDLDHLGKQPDWSYDEEDSGAYPAARLDSHRT